MALNATVYNFSVQLADIDRGVYENLELRLARQSSETAEYLLVRVLAYCLEYTEGIVLTEGVAAVDEPAVLVRDLTGRITAWIEVGTPDAERLHRGSKLAGRAAVYVHRDPQPYLNLLAGQRIHRAEAIPLLAFDRAFLRDAAAALQRRSALSLSVTEGQLYLDIDGKAYASPVERHSLA